MWCDDMTDTSGECDFPAQTPQLVQWGRRFPETHRKAFGRRKPPWLTKPCRTKAMLAWKGTHPEAVLTLYLMEMFVRCSHWLHPLWRVFEATFHMCPNFQQSFLRRSPIWTGSLAAIRPKRASWAIHGVWKLSGLLANLHKSFQGKQRGESVESAKYWTCSKLTSSTMITLSLSAQQAVQRPKLTKILPRVWLWWPGTAAKTWSFRSWGCLRTWKC